MTDSVNELAFFDICLLFEGDGVVICQTFSHKKHKKHKMKEFMLSFLCLLWLRNNLFASGFAL